jgi:uncharacterized protein
MRVTRRFALRSLAGAGVAAAGLGAYGFAYERRHAVVTQTTVALGHLPPALAGLRIGLLSDIHYGDFFGRENVQAAASLLMAQHPDLILLAGDHVTWGNRALVPSCVDALSALSAPLGVFAVAGNHDPEQTLVQVFQAHRVQVLRDEHVQLAVRGETLALGGLRYWSQRTKDLARTFRGASGFPILLAHDPRRLTQAAELGLPLLLSGHTHGGQVVLPLIGAPAGYRFRVVSGLGQERATTIYVTRGLGTVMVPVRFNCPPEVAVLTLSCGP